MNSMTFARRAGLVTVAILSLTWILPGAAPEAGAQERGNRVVLAAREPEPYVLPNRPWWKLDEVLSRHEGRPSWTHDLVDDGLLKAQYISMAPGERTTTRMHAEHPVLWIVQDGQIRFTIDGQEPFVASKHWLVQVPYLTPFTLETVGDVPSLRFEVTIPGSSILYPLDVTPDGVAGDRRGWEPVTVGGGGSYERAVSGARAGGQAEVITPYFDFNEVIGQGDAGRGRVFMRDHRLYANVNRGAPQPAVPDTEWGHFHPDYGEMWFILEGEIDYLIEGIGFFTARQGDVVYASRNRWHRPRNSVHATGMSTRVAINPYPNGLHVFQPPPEMR
jgi:mannose-6-phosphate isomerase-like protein (cupin superfamily)